MAILPSGIVMISGSLFLDAEGRRYRKLEGTNHATYVQLCAATNRREPHDLCERSRVAGRDYCVIHGGHYPVGVDAPQFRHGRYSKFIALPDLHERVDVLLRDPELNSLRANLALVDARIGQLLERIDGQSATPFWLEAGALMQQYVEALDTDSPNAPALLRRLRALLEGGYDEDSVWREIAVQHELRRRLTESEGKMLDRMGHTFTVEEATLFIRELASMMREFVAVERHGEFVQRLRMLQVGSFSATRRARRADDD